MVGAPGAADAAAARIAQLLERYEPPSFGHVPDPDAALFLCSVDHRTGYRGRYLVDGRGPFTGSELMWAVALRSARRRPGLLTAAGLREVGAREVAAVFAIGGETVADPERRAALWRDLALGLENGYAGRTENLLEAANGSLGGPHGLLARLAVHSAFADPLAKKAQLFAKIAARRGWFAVADPECFEVSADSVLMRLALRSGLVAPGQRDEVRAATRSAFKALAARVGVEPPVLDDLLWELGREDPDLLGAAAGDLREPPRDPASAWY